MTENEEQLKLYSFAFVARRQDGPMSDTGLGAGLTLAASEEDAERKALEAALEAYPVAERWENHESVAYEAAQGMAFDSGHRLTWRVEAPPQKG